MKKEQYEKVMKNETMKKIKKLAKENGYAAQPFYIPKYDEDTVIGELVAVGEYAPIIYINSNGKIELHTVSYGDLKGEELKMYIESMENGFNLVKELEKIDFSTLEVI